MPSGKPYILFCAGEDSGDCIGENLVRALHNGGAQGRFDAVGSGGARMRSAGLVPLVDYENLPVSGFGDVLPKYLKLRQSYAALERALKNSACKGLVAIDYPGFNMKLVGLAGKLGKPSLYVAPPQVWAWKENRAKRLAKVPHTQLAVFFDFEKVPYENAGCKVSLLRHPFVEHSGRVLSAQEESQAFKKKILMLPGSRKSQALRNVPVFLGIAQKFQDQQFTFVAARQSLLQPIKDCICRYFKGQVPSWIQVEESPLSPEERCLFYRNSLAAISAPGTATLELSLSGVPMIVCTKPDGLTYVLGKRFVKTSHFALPNIIHPEGGIPEFVEAAWNEQSFELAASTLKSALEKGKDTSAKLASSLVKKIAAGLSSEQLMSEFLAQFVQG